MKENPGGRASPKKVIKAGIPQAVVMAISGHKTDSTFRRYAIMDKNAVPEAFQVLLAQ